MLLSQAFPKAVAQCPQPLAAAIKALQCQFCRFGKSHDQWHRQRARPYSLLLAAAPNNGFQSGVGVANQRSDSFRSVQFVGAKAEYIGTNKFGIQWDLAERLSSIAVQRYAMSSSKGCDFRKWLNNADFIVGQHHAD